MHFLLYLCHFWKCVNRYLPFQVTMTPDLFIIPEGTLVERFQYHGMEFARFIYPFSFFLLMEQFTKSLSVITFEVGKSWYCYDNLTELVQIGFQFINYILKRYQGDFRTDVVLRTLVQTLRNCSNTIL
ncbi:hypothetical protein NQ314_020734 [Rhamnusium bicolor]|uniref:Maturase K n=1 Tax=Rhamnusium bicolor TaxID=1586634 RepID=A0AAV8WKN3_9CUCU|nr:hypothetical protein NQ314_020734 [Rhamnusium bicolor]